MFFDYITVLDSSCSHDWLIVVFVIYYYHIESTFSLYTTWSGELVTFPCDEHRVILVVSCAVVSCAMLQSG